MDTENKKKRIRAANFTPDEKKLCLQLALKYKSIIENKKTDACSKEEKDEVWGRIAHEFNSQCPGLIKRTSGNLKNFFENQKRAARKQVAEKKVKLNRTGGGPSETRDDDPLTDITLQIINEKTVAGLTSLFDDDANDADMEYEVELPSSAQVIADSEPLTEPGESMNIETGQLVPWTKQAMIDRKLSMLSENSPLRGAIGIEKKQLQKTPRSASDVKISLVVPSTSADIPSREIVEVKRKQIVAGTTNPSQVLNDQELSTLSEDILSRETIGFERKQFVTTKPASDVEVISVKTPSRDTVGVQRKQMVGTTGRKWASRRRPVANATLNLAKTYEDLAATKNELAQLQLAVLQKQAAEEDRNRERNTSKNELEREALLSLIGKNNEERLYWEQRRKHEVEKFQMEKGTLLLSLKLKQHELANKQ